MVSETYRNNTNSIASKRRKSGTIGATKASYLDDAVGAISVKLSDEDISYLEEPYIPHRIVGAVDSNPPDGVILLDEKK